MLDSLRIKNFRCFEDLQIESLGRVNLIVGKNNTGKTTFLEAIQMYTNSGSGYFVDDLLTKRGESEFKKDPHVDDRHSKIYFDRQKPTSFDTRLEISDIANGNALIFSPMKEETSEYIESITKEPRKEMVDLFGDTYVSTINIRKSNLIDESRTGKTDTALFLSTHLRSESDLAKIWDHIFLNTDDSIIRDALKIIEQDIVNIAFIPSNNNRIAVVKIKNKSKAIPIKTLGEGMSRILQLFLYAIQAQNGFLLIDEFENGLHYSIQEEVWEKLFKLAEELDIQVFATTHSMDTIKSFSKVALKSEQEGRLISLGRNTRGTDKGKITALTYNEADIKLIAETGMEVR